MIGDNISIGNVTLAHLINFFIIFTLTIFASRIIYAILRRIFDTRISLSKSKQIARSVQYVIISMGLLYGIYDILQLDLTAIATSLGIIGIVVALSSQQILQNFIGGLLIAATKPFQIDDWVKIGGSPDTTISNVKEINLTSTLLRDIDGKIFYVPNSVLLTSKIINYTKSGFIELLVQITVPLNTDVNQIRETILEIINNNPRILPNISNDEKKKALKILKIPRIQHLFEEKVNLNKFTPKVLISNISNQSITLDIRIWIQDILLKDEIISELLESIINKLKEKKIKL